MSPSTMTGRLSIDAHRQPMPDIAFVHVEHQYLAHDRWLAADGDPLLVSTVMHNNVAKNSQHTFYWFHQFESLVASSSEHAVR